MTMKVGALGSCMLLCWWDMCQQQRRLFMRCLEEDVYKSHVVTMHNPWPVSCAGLGGAAIWKQKIGTTWADKRSGLEHAIYGTPACGDASQVSVVGSLNLIVPHSHAQRDICFDHAPGSGVQYTCVFATSSALMIFCSAMQLSTGSCNWDCSRVIVTSLALLGNLEQDAAAIAALRNRFVTGDWDQAAQRTQEQEAASGKLDMVGL